MKKKKVKSILIVLFCLAFAFPIVSGCLNGNFQIILVGAGDGGSDITACCVGVGDGSAFSCTDGNFWWCWGNCGDPYAY
jgi:hypothetical protein